MDDQYPDMESKRAKIIADIIHEIFVTDYHTKKASVILSKVNTDSLVIEQITKNKTLHVVSENGNVKLVKELLSIGVDMDYLNDNGKSPLHIACKNKNSKIVRELLKNGANPNLRSTELEKLPLHYVLEDGYGEDGTRQGSEQNKEIFEIINLLLKHGADINAEDRCGQTALYYATYYRNIAAVRLLLKNGAKPDCGKEYPLFAASHYNEIEIVEELLNHGAEINPKSEGIHRIPLYIASERGHLELIDKLLEYGADVNLPNLFARTPLYAACEKGHFEIVKKLLRHGANPNFQIWYMEAQSLPIHLAIEGGYLEIVKELLKHGADVNALDDEFTEANTPLHVAVLWGHVTIVKELLKNGANVNAKTNEDESVLHMAIRQDFHDRYQDRLCIIQLLLKDESIYLNLRNGDDLTPLEKALKLEHMEIARMIAKKK